MLATINTMQETVARHFARGEDGFWYPLEAGVPLVRIRMDARTYQVQRRRRPTTAWMTLVTASHAEFDSEAFETWRSNWSLVA